MYILVTKKTKCLTPVVVAPGGTERLGIISTVTGHRNSDK